MTPALLNLVLPGRVMLGQWRTQELSVQVNPGPVTAAR